MLSLYSYVLRWLTIHSMRWWWIGKVEGLERVPPQGPCIVICNHASYLDFMILSSIFQLDLGHLLRFWAGPRITRHWFFRHYCERAGCLEVGGEGIKAAWRASRRCLTERNDFLCIFPEGTRTRTGQLQDFKPGYLRLAVESQAPILPVRLRGSYRAWPPHRLLPRFRRIDIEFYEPLRIGTDLSASGLGELNTDLRARCYEAG
jgi:1-acyl-sn-glycerol-3-phosphate acyltransferase